MTTGFKVITKPVTSVYDNTSGTFKRKCNFDVEITVEALDKIKQYSELVLCSGDGDFVKLLKYIKGKYKKATVISFKDRANQQLIKTANRTIYIEQIKDQIKR